MLNKLIFPQFWAKKIQERVLNVRRRAARNENGKYLDEGIVILKCKPGRKKTKVKYTLPSLPEERRRRH